MPPSLYIGVHHAGSQEPAGQAIILGTEALLSNYVMGPKLPATHAFVVVDCGGIAWRLDGQPPHSLWSPWEGPHAGPPAAYWKMTPTTAVAAMKSAQDRVEGAIQKARSLGGEPYDWGEIAAQAAAALSVLPVLHRLKFLGRVDPFQGAMICTKVAMTVIGALGGVPAQTMASMTDLFPERLAQELRRAEGDWCVRLVDAVPSSFG